MSNPLDPPPGLAADRRAIWVDTVAQVMAAGTLERLDPNSLQAYVEAVWRQRRAATLLQQTDVLIEQGGQAKANPAVQVMDQAARAIAAFARQFRLNAATPGTPDQPAQPQNVPAPGVQPGRWCEQHRRRECTSRNAKGGDCHAIAKLTTGRCGFHDGRSKAVRLAEKLGVTIPTYGAPRRIRAEQAVLEELWRTAGHVAWLGDRVAALETEALTWGTTQSVHRWWGEFPGSEELRKAGPHVLLDLYYRERRHLVDVAMGILQHGLAARMVDEAKERGTAMAQLVDAILHDLDLSQEQWKRVPQVVPARFRELMPA